MSDANAQTFFQYEENDQGYAITAYNKAGDASVTELEIPAVYNEKPVTEIGDCAFLGANCIKKVFLPESVTRIGFEAFSSCKDLEEINLPFGLTEILDESFSGCTSLKSIQIPEGVTEIGEYAFNSCYKLEHVKLPQSLKIIGPRVFSRDMALGEIELPSGLEEMGEGIFADSENVSVKYQGKIYTQDNMAELKVVPAEAANERGVSDEDGTPKGFWARIREFFQKLRKQ